VQMYAVRERREQRGMRRANVREEILQVGARFEHQRASQFAVERMLDDHVENPNAIVEKYLEFLFGSFRRMFAGENRSMAAIGFCGQAIARGRRQNFLAAGAEDCHVLDQALAAHSEVLRDLPARHRPAAGAQPFNDLAAAIAGRIRSVRLQPFSPRCKVCRRRLELSCHISSLLYSARSV